MTKQEMKTTMTHEEIIQWANENEGVVLFFRHGGINRTVPMKLDDPLIVPVIDEIEQTAGLPTMPPVRLGIKQMSELLDEVREGLGADAEWSSHKSWTDIPQSDQSEMRSLARCLLNWLPEAPADEPEYPVFEDDKS